MLCAQNQSLSSSEVLKTLQDSVNCGLRSLGKERIKTVADGHCVLYAWANGFKVTKRAFIQSLTSELLSHTSHYFNFLTRTSIKVLLQDYLIKRIYKNDDTDILLSALSNEFQCDVTLYQYRGNITDLLCL